MSGLFPTIKPTGKSSYIPFSRLFPVGLGYVKDKAYTTSVPDVEALKSRITDAIHSVSAEILKKTWCEIDWMSSGPQKGDHVEVY